MNHLKLTSWLFAALLAVSAAGCDKPGPLERAGEEIDEAVETMKDGKESTANKVDDAVDDVRDGVNDAVDELKKE